MAREGDVERERGLSILVVLSCFLVYIFRGERRGRGGAFRVLYARGVCKIMGACGLVVWLCGGGVGVLVVVMQSGLAFASGFISLMPSIFGILIYFNSPNQGATFQFLFQ